MFNKFFKKFRPVFLIRSVFLLIYRKNSLLYAYLEQTSIRDTRYGLTRWCPGLAKTARKSWYLLHRSCWVALEIHILRTSPRMEVPLGRPYLYKKNQIRSFNRDSTLSCFLQVVLRWYGTFNRDFLKNSRPGRLIEQYA